MPKKYAGLIKVVLLTTFYASAIPFAYIFTIVGLIAWFWADKVIFPSKDLTYDDSMFY